MHDQRCFICGYKFGPNIDSRDIYRKWGAPSVIELYDSDYWGLITSNFLHVELWHLACNLYWLWIFGKKIEFENSRTFYVFLILSSALVSSLAQLAFSDATGIGLSGIGYSLFGFLWVKSKTTEEYRNCINKKTVKLFVFWLVLCIILTRAGAWTVGNAAHVGGLLWGVTIAYLSKHDKYTQMATGSVYLAILIALIFYSPFSTSFLSYQAYQLHKYQKVEEAIVIYQRILKRDPNSEFAKENLKQLQLHKLQEKAVELQTSQKYNEARELYNQILIIDKDNEWAKENLSKLPRG